MVSLVTVGQGKEKASSHVLAGPASRPLQSVPRILIGDLVSPAVVPDTVGVLLPCTVRGSHVTEGVMAPLASRGHLAWWQ